MVKALNPFRVLIVGAGLAGLVLGRQLASIPDIEVEIWDVRTHLAGNCYTEQMGDITVHKYGPHIFHSPNKGIFDAVAREISLKPYVHRVSGLRRNNAGTLPLPVNLETLSILAGEKLGAKAAKRWIEAQVIKLDFEPRNFEEAVLAKLGRTVYEECYEGYTFKQWGVEPSKLPASLARRLPIRFSRDRNYHHSKFVGMPLKGYTPLFEKLADHPKIRVRLGHKFSRRSPRDFDHVFHSGAIDQHFDYDLGALGYRNVGWDSSETNFEPGGLAQLNYLSPDIRYTRRIDHARLSPWVQTEKTLVSKEYAFETKPGEIPFYPKRLAKDKAIFEEYRTLARRTRDITFIGRLGTYQYLDMWEVISQMLALAEQVKSQAPTGSSSLDLPKVYDRPANPPRHISLFPS